MITGVVRSVGFRAVDLETIGFLDEAPQSVRDEPCTGIVEIGYTDISVNFAGDGRFLGATIDAKPGALLFNPPGGIPPQASAIHHIRPRDVDGLPPCTPGSCQLLLSPPEPSFLIAHNVKFEREWLDKYLPKTTWLCTYKVAARLFPDWPAHSNQACRYLLGLELDGRADPPHRAGPDTFVTAHVFLEFLKQTSVRQMAEWTRLPTLQSVCQIGEHRGKPWVQVPEDYLRWIVGDKPKNMDEDTRWNAQRALEDRAQLRAQPDLGASDY